MGFIEFDCFMFVEEDPTVLESRSSELGQSVIKFFCCSRWLALLSSEMESHFLIGCFFGPVIISSFKADISGPASDVRFLRSSPEKLTSVILGSVEPDGA